MTSAALRRLQWAVRATLTLGVAASVTANILHARDNPISQAIAAWPPLALLITVELVSRIPIVHRWLGVVRVVSTAAIAGIAAWVSYWHMAGVVARYGETGTVPYLLPLSVDGLIVVASVSLVELAGRRRDTAPAPVPAAAPTAAPAAPARPARTGDSPPGPASADQNTAVPADQAPTAAHSEPPFATDPAAEGEAQPSPGQDDDERANAHEAGDDNADEDQDDGNDDADRDGVDLAPDLVPLLPAARTARDELVREGRTVSRDALAHRLRRNGHAIRNNRVSELLNALRREEPSLNGVHPTISA